MITSARLKELLEYSADTGAFYWRVARARGAKAGGKAGSTCNGFRDGGGGYVYIGIDGRVYSAHRLAWLYVHGSWPKDQLDHINMDRRDNRLSNLREATRSQNCGNRTKQSRNTSGYKGVSFHKRSGSFVATVKRKYIGLYPTAELAHAAYCEAARKEFGDFART